MDRMLLEPAEPLAGVDGMRVLVGLLEIR